MASEANASGFGRPLCNVCRHRHRICPIPGLRRMMCRRAFTPGPAGARLALSIACVVWLVEQLRCIRLVELRSWTVFGQVMNQNHCTMGRPSRPSSFHQHRLPLPLSTLFPTVRQDVVDQGLGPLAAAAGKHPFHQSVNGPSRRRLPAACQRKLLRLWCGATKVHR